MAIIPPPPLLPPVAVARHIAVAAMLFLEHANDPKVDVVRVITMLLILG